MTTPSLDLPSWVITAMRDLGFDAPNGKEGTMLDMGTTWVAHGSKSAKPPQDAMTAANDLLAQNKSAAVEAFGKDFKSPTAPAANLSDASTGAKGIGIGTMSLGGIELSLKLSNVAQVGMLLVEIAGAVAEAPFTGGASLLEIPLFKEAATVGFHTAINTASSAVKGH
jgi:hypothetical protein